MQGLGHSAEVWCLHSLAESAPFPESSEGSEVQLQAENGGSPSREVPLRVFLGFRVWGFNTGFSFKGLRWARGLGFRGLRFGVVGIVV